MRLIWIRRQERHMDQGPKTCHRRISLRLCPRDVFPKIMQFLRNGEIMGKCK